MTELKITSRSAHVKDEPAAGWADPDADRALTALFNQHYSSLVRLAALLLGDTASAEEVVQVSFVALHRARSGRGSDQLSYLRQAVVTRSRSRLRHRILAGGNATATTHGRTGREGHAITNPQYQTLMSALRQLPVRQREVIVLRYYSELSEAQIAAAMRTSRAAVRSHTARATASPTWLTIMDS
jgi:RNA polymerase sigma factor (sigma-70 family)